MPGAADDAALSVDVRRGAPTDEELAALIAVVTEAYRTEASAALADDDAEASAWSRTQRSLRQPLRRDLRWGRFAG